MAGNPQGGGAPKPAGNPMQGMQGMQQNMAGMPSQYPGANMAAPGGMQQQFGMAKPAVMPQGSQTVNTLPAYAGPAPQGQQQPPQMSQPLPMAPQGQNMASAAVMPQEWQWQNLQGQQDQNMASAAVMPQAPISVGSSQPMQQQPAQLSPEMMAQIQVAAQRQMASQQTQVNNAPQPMPRPMPMPQDARMQQNPRMTPRVSDVMPQREQMARPQIQGNPNAMPVQRPQRRNMMGG